MSDFIAKSDVQEVIRKVIDDRKRYTSHEKI